MIRAVSLALLLAGCSPAELLNATVSSSGIAVQHDVRYAPGDRGTADVYRPVQHGAGTVRGDAPLVVFLYGGSWRMGDKAMYAFVGRPLAALGAVVVIPDYRLYPEVQYPAFLDDNAAAVAWALAHAAEWGANPRRVFIVGHSAGAYNAAMLGLDPQYLGRAGVTMARVAGVVGLAGPYDFLPIDDADVVPVFASAPNDPATQPINHVDGHNPPMLLLAGDADTIVKPGNTTRLARRIAAAGGSVESRLYPGIGHIGIITAFAPLFEGRAPALDDVWAFIQQQDHLP